MTRKREGWRCVNKVKECPLRDSSRCSRMTQGGDCVARACCPRRAFYWGGGGGGGGGGGVGWGGARPPPFSPHCNGLGVREEIGKVVINVNITQFEVKKV
jgi:hypothetical protein